MMIKTKRWGIFTGVALWGMVIALPWASLAEEKQPLSQEEAAEVIVKRLPTADTDADGRVRCLFMPLSRLADLTALRACSHLFYPEAADNHLTNLKGLEHCQEFTDLNFNYNQLASLEGIEELATLESLCLFGNDLADVSPLRELQHRQCVVLTDNPQLAESQLAALKEALPERKVVFESQRHREQRPTLSTTKQSKLEDSTQLALAPQETPPEADEPEKLNFITEKLTPFAAAVQRPQAWFFWKKEAEGDFTWIISKEKVGEEKQQFETGVKIRAFYNVSKKAKKSPEEFAAEYLKTKVARKGMKVLHQAKQKVGPLTALTQTIELAEAISATDLYWGDGKELDVLVVVTREAPKTKWNASQPLFGRLTRFNLRAVVQGTRDQPPVDEAKQK